MKRSRKPSVNPAHQWEQLTAAVIEFGKNVRVLNARVAALEQRAGMIPEEDALVSQILHEHVTKN